MNNQATIVTVIIVIVIASGFMFLNRPDNTSTHNSPSIEEITQPTSTQNPTRSQAPTSSPTEAPKNLAPDFNLIRLNGEQITLSEFRGEKPVILEFWASWCHNCQRSLPKLNKLYEQYGDQVEVIAINLQEKESVARGYAEKIGLKFPIALDPQGQVSSSYGIRYTNTHFLINKAGELVKVIPGDIGASEFELLIQES